MLACKGICDEACRGSIFSQSEKKKLLLQFLPFGHKRKKIFNEIGSQFWTSVEHLLFNWILYYKIIEKIYKLWATLPENPHIIYENLSEDKP